MPYTVYVLTKGYGWAGRKFKNARQARLFRNAKWDAGMKAFMTKGDMIVK